MDIILSDSEHFSMYIVKVIMPEFDKFYLWWWTKTSDISWKLNFHLPAFCKNYQKTMFFFMFFLFNNL